MGFIIHVSSVSCGVPSFDAGKLQEKELWREHPRSVDDPMWLSWNGELISQPKLGLKFNLLPSSDIRLVCVSCLSLHWWLSSSRALPLFFPDECGIVAQISQPLADSDISAYYISTFSFDHALVSPHIFISSLGCPARMCSRRSSCTPVHLTVHWVRFKVGEEGKTMNEALKSERLMCTWNKSVNSSLSGGIFVCHERMQWFVWFF